jgi:hypothetical protein
MILYSTVAKSFFWIGMGLVYAMIIAGAPYIAKDLGLQMTWWKWSLAALWYIILSIGVAAGFTVMGEREPGAAKYFFSITIVSMAILGSALWHIFHRF